MAVRRIEEAVTELLHGDARETALDFAAYLQKNEILLGESENYWEAKYKDQSVCFIWVDGSDQLPGPWTVWSDQEPGTWIFWSNENTARGPDAGIVDEPTKETAWKNANFCADCGGCSPGKTKTILGKEFEHLCNSALAFTNPDAAALQCIKSMVDTRKSDILKKTV